jgi:hypothetical protein
MQPSQFYTPYDIRGQVALVTGEQLCSHTWHASAARVLCVSCASHVLLLLLTHLQVPPLGLAGQLPSAWLRLAASL